MKKICKITKITLGIKQKTYYNEFINREGGLSMVLTKNSLENLKVQHAYLDASIRHEETLIWKNLVKIEELKKQKLKQKDALLRQMIQNCSSRL